MIRKVVSLMAAALVGAVVTLGAPTAPAHAAITGCGTNMCFADTVSSADYSYPPNYPRNTCINVSSGPNIEVYDNGTQYVWFIFKTSACSGSHETIYGGWDGGILGTFGSTWDEGALHGVMRTSTVA
jgi:hypothetical protein